jgi:hypothetical protein
MLETDIQLATRSIAQVHVALTSSSGLALLGSDRIGRRSRESGPSQRTDRRKIFRARQYNETIDWGVSVLLPSVQRGKYATLGSRRHLVPLSR